jgi:hypothetical protein
LHAGAASRKAFHTNFLGGEIEVPAPEIWAAKDIGVKCGEVSEGDEGRQHNTRCSCSLPWLLTFSSFFSVRERIETVLIQVGLTSVSGTKGNLYGSIAVMSFLPLMGMVFGGLACSYYPEPVFLSTAASAGVNAFVSNFSFATRDSQYTVFDKRDNKTVESLGQLCWVTDSHALYAMCMFAAAPAFPITVVCIVHAAQTYNNLVFPAQLTNMAVANAEFDDSELVVERRGDQVQWLNRIRNLPVAVKDYHGNILNYTFFAVRVPGYLVWSIGFRAMVSGSNAFLSNNPAWKIAAAAALALTDMSAVIFALPVQVKEDNLLRIALCGAVIWAFVTSSSCFIVNDSMSPLPLDLYVNGIVPMIIVSSLVAYWQLKAA